MKDERPYSKQFGDALLKACIDYRAQVNQLESENTALRELIVKEGYTITYFNDEIGLCRDPWHQPKEDKP